MTGTERSAGTTLTLFQRARAGDLEAYDASFAHAAPRLRLFCRLRLGSRLRGEVDSLDVLQEAYLEAHRGFDSFQWRGPGSFASWLCRIVENRLRGLADHYGAQKRRLPSPGAPDAALRERAAASVTGPVSAAARNESLQRLEQAMRTLDDEVGLF